MGLPSEHDQDRRRARGLGVATSLFLAATLICAAVYAGGFIVSDPFPDDRVAAREGAAAELAGGAIAATAPGGLPEEAPGEGAVLGTSFSSDGEAARRRARRAREARLRAQRRSRSVATSPVKSVATPAPTASRPRPATTASPAQDARAEDDQTLLAEPVRQTAGTVRSTGAGVGAELGEVSPPVGEAVTEVTDQAAGLVESVGDLLP